MAKKVGSDGQIRKTTAEWAADTDTYPEGMRLMDTDTGVVRVSKGTTYALAWTPSAGGATAWGGITGTLSDQTDLQQQLETLANAVGAIVIDDIRDGEVSTSPSEDAVFDALALKADITSFPKRYKFTGDGGAATGTIGVNTYGVTINVTNTGTGTYRFTAASGTPFTLTGKTTVNVIPIDNTSFLGWRVFGLDNDQIDIEFFTTDSITLTDPAQYQITITTEP